MARIDAFDLEDFPKLSLSQIRKHITFGSYQIKQAISYVADHLSPEGKFEILNDNRIENENSSEIL